MDNRQSLRLEVAQYYLNNRTSFRLTALKYGIAYCTVFKWVKLYKEQGEERFLSTYKRPWNRADSDLEKKIVLMKEHEPNLTVRKAKDRLEKQNIRISIKGIWGIWKRYGYAGFSREDMSGHFTDCVWTKEAQQKYELAKRMFNHGSVDRAAEILNSIPALPENELLPQIPDSQLNIRRQIEKMELLFGKMPVRSYLERLRILSEKCKRQNLYYSALIVGLVETVALSWSEGPVKMLKKVAELKNILKKNEDCYSYLLFTPRFTLLLGEGIAYARLLKIEEASDIARRCCRLLKRRKHVVPRFMRHLGQLYVHLRNYREAEYWYSKSIEKLSGDNKKRTISLLADIFVKKGEYKKAVDIWKDLHMDHWGNQAQRLRIQSIWSLIRGMPDKAISLAVEALALLKKEELKIDMFAYYLIIASAYCSLGEKTRARRTLEKILPFSVKNRLEEVKTIIEIILSQTLHDKDSMSLYEQYLPTIKLALMLGKGQYTRALKYAEKRGIIGFLHQYIFFFPEAVTPLLEKGKSTNLPGTMLKLPVFRKEIPVYAVKFLGNLVIYKNQQYLRVNLTPKDTAFLIYLCHKAMEPNKSLDLDEVYAYFWPKSKNPSRNLSHLLVRIKKALKMPSHLLEISHWGGEAVLINRGIHFITDYGEFKQILAQAKALERAGDWAFAKKEYLQALKLFRGEPFKKIYDNWSDDKRLEIIFSYETEILSFVKKLIKRGKEEQAKKLLKSAKKIIPYSQEIKNLLNEQQNFQL
jgi:tetratricopeptide (TPR) repeat protein